MLIAGEVDRLNCLQTALPMHSKELVGGSAADEIYEGRRDKRSTIRKWAKSHSQERPMIPVRYDL